MRYSYTGKNIPITDDFKDRVEKKVSRINKLIPDDGEVYVTASKIRHQHKLEVSVPLHKRMLRAEVMDNDLNSCIDTVVDVLEKQAIKYKGRLRERSRRNVATGDELSYIQESTVPENTPDVVIHRTKRFDLKPMDAIDAVMEMELLGHSFFVFRSAATDEVNVVYKRKDDEYGLIEPE
ncbi:MAG: ribosome-associated translation inhibitor RaiA [Defluviitaleaceae bacterium]|nr:ribosome-associated translation inhibitor RaiA [Defluviitaleaceae bacterium]